MNSRKQILSWIIQEGIDIMIGIKNYYYFKIYQHLPWIYKMSLVKYYIDFFLFIFYFNIKNNMIDLYSYIINITSIKIYGSFLLFLIIGTIVLPGKIVLGHPEPKRYKQL